MQLDSPFGPKRSDAAATASAQASPSLPQSAAAREQYRAEQDENSRRFAQLKPICVELLGQVGAAARTETHAKIYVTLQRLSSKLHSFHASIGPKRNPLSLALISYVFFPVAQLLRTLSAPPDRILCELFQILAALAQDWWQAWIETSDTRNVANETSVRQQWKIWEQLLMLAATTLTPRPGELNEHSEETTLAVLSLLHNVLAARTVDPVSANEASSSSLFEAETSIHDSWEWDGEADLPDLDDYDREMQKVEAARAEAAAAAVSNETIKLKSKPERVLIYPSSMHILESYASNSNRGALAHVLSASLDLARSPQRPRQVRVESLRLARVLLHVWFAGLDVDLRDVERCVEHVVSEKVITQAKRKSSEFKPASRAKRLSAFLPGVVSATVRICTEFKALADVASQALRLLRLILILSLADEAVSTNEQKNDGQDDQQTLESLIATAHIFDEEENRDSANDDLQASLLSVPNNKGDTKILAGFELIDSQEKISGSKTDTTARIAAALQAVSPLSAHEHADVQVAMIELAGDIVLLCSVRFKSERNDPIDIIQMLFGWLLELAAQEDGRAARLASDFIVRILNTRSGSESLVATEIVSLAQQIPRLLTSFGQDVSLYAAARRLRYLIRLASGAVDPLYTSFDDLRTLLESRNGYERWTISVISSILIDEQATSLVGDADIVRLQTLEARTSCAVTDVFVELGAAAGRLFRLQVHAEPLALAEHLMELAARWRRATTGSNLSLSGLRNRQMSVSALLLAKEVIAGVAGILDDGQTALLPGKQGSRIRKQARRFAHSIVNNIVEMWQTDEEELLQSDLAVSLPYTHALSAHERQLIRSQTDTPLVLTGDYRRGVEEQHALSPSVSGSSAAAPQLGPAVNVDFVQAATISSLQLQTSSITASSKALTRQQRETRAFKQASRSDALLLAILSSCGRILGSAVKPLLLQTIYPTLCAIASGSDAVRVSATSALQTVAHAAGYASVQGCLLDHADYVLGAASHRLVSTLGQELETRSRISSPENGSTADPTKQYYSPLLSAMSAPLVLAELIRTLGNEVVVLVEDAIDEVLDAIDRFHADQEICDGLLSVLDRMLEAILQQSKISSNEESNPREQSPDAQISFQPNNQRDFDEFAQWYRTRNEETPVSNVEDIGDEKQGTGAAFDEDDAPTTDTATRSQQVILSMLKKAVPFLSHGSRTLRLRCLRLINRGVEVLCRQHRTAEPLSVVNTLWPLLMSRLGFNLSRTLPELDNHRGKLALPRAEDLDETDFFVAVEAVNLVSTLATHLIQYLGREKMLKQAVPRVLLLLRIVEHAESRPGSISQGGARDQKTFLLKDRDRGAAEPSPSSTITHAAFRPVRRHSALSMLLERAIVMLDALVGSTGAAMTEADLYALAEHPTLLSGLDTRQYDTLQSLSRRLYFDTLSKRSAALVWFIVKAANARAGEFPVFMYRPVLSLGIPPMYF